MDATTWLLVAPLVGMTMSFPLLSAKVDRNYVYLKKWRYIIWVLFFGGVAAYLGWTGVTFQYEDGSIVRYLAAVMGAWMGLAITLIAYKSRKILFATQLAPERIEMLSRKYRRIQTSNHPMTWKLGLAGFAIMVFAYIMDDIMPKGVLPVSDQHYAFIWFSLMLTGLAIGSTGLIWDEYELYKQKRL